MPIKLIPPSTIHAEYQIITPMFIGDANKMARRISPLSAKGALRFWWRALQWKTLITQYSPDEALQKLHEKESRLFGNTPNASEAGAGKGKFVLKVSHNDLSTINNWPTNYNSNSGYLAFGLLADKKTPRRNAIAAQQQFTLTLILDSEITDSEKQSLNDTLQLFGLVGGLGSRSRRAMGSVQLIKLNEQPIIYRNVDEYKSALSPLIGDSFTGTLKLKDAPPFSALSTQTQWACQMTASDKAIDAHAQLGVRYKQYRGQESNLRGASKTVLGLPLPNVSKNAERRASPLFFHVFQIQTTEMQYKYGYTALSMPTALFHPHSIYQSVEWEPLTDFFNDARS